jgi:hypothetical protein
MKQKGSLEHGSRDALFVQLDDEQPRV